MSESNLLQHPRHRFVAFSAVGVAMVCLPLWQVLRYQQSDLNQLAAERALLDPVAQAVHVQFGLLAHRQVAAQLLQGRPHLEPARQAVQVGVDEQLLALSQVLAQGMWSHALAESRDLARDWQALALRVKARALTPVHSDEAHALRVEQAVQVVDLVTLADTLTDAGTATPGGANSSARFVHATQNLSHLAHELQVHALAHTLAPAQPMPSTADGAWPAAAPADRATAEARLLHRLLNLQLALASAPLAAALAEVDHSTRQVLQLQAGAGAAMATEEWRQQRASSLQKAHQAQLALFSQALVQHKRWLSERHNTVQRQQVALLAALALLTAAALTLAAVLMRQQQMHTATVNATPSNPPSGRAPQTPQDTAQPERRAAESGAWNAPPAGGLPTPTKVEALRLFGRLRSGPDAPQAQPQPGRHEPEETLPPDRS